MRLSEVDYLGYEGFAEDDVVGFDVEVADSKVGEVHHPVHHVEQDE